MNRFREWIEKQWYRKTLNPLLWIFIPLSGVYFLIIKIREMAYRIYKMSQMAYFNTGGFKKNSLTTDPVKKGKFSAGKSKIPIIVVGNITVGGTGKTPLVIHIAKLLKQHTMRVGIVSRGYQGQGSGVMGSSPNTQENIKGSERNMQPHSPFKKTSQEPVWVFANSDPNVVGDEPLLLAKRLFCPIVVDKCRPKAVQLLIDSGQVDVIISDDGLQHYALDRVIEIAVVDGKRRFGNGWLLPLGPLREPKSRLKSVDFVVVNGPVSYDNDQEYDMELRPRTMYKGNDPGTQHPLSYFQGQTVHAIAGIGFPDRFFDLLKTYGLNLITHPFPDHYRFTKEDIDFKDDVSVPMPILMTEKDAVKCSGMMDDRHWVLAVDAAVNPLFDMRLLTQLQEFYRG